MIQKLAIYCGSAPGSDPAFAEVARDLVREMASRGIDMVYGGGRLGLMGIIADEMLAAGGRVYGVIPQALVDHEVAHTGLTELTTVANMHERKAKMTELCDGFVAQIEGDEAPGQGSAESGRPGFGDRTEQVLRNSGLGQLRRK